MPPKPPREARLKFFRDVQVDDEVQLSTRSKPTVVTSKEYLEETDAYRFTFATTEVRTVRPLDQVIYLPPPPNTLADEKKRSR